MGVGIRVEDFMQEEVPMEPKMCRLIFL